VTLSTDFSSLFAHIPNLRQRGDLLEGNCIFCKHEKRLFEAQIRTGTWRCSVCGRKGNADAFKRGVGELQDAGPEQPQAQEDSDGTRSARDRGGRPRVKVSREELKYLRAQRMSWRRIGETLGIGASTALYLWRDGTTPKSGKDGVQKPRKHDIVGQLVRFRGMDGSR